MYFAKNVVCMVVKRSFQDTNKNDVFLSLTHIEETIGICFLFVISGTVFVYHSL